jgi:hypothetical protein
MIFESPITVWKYLNHQWQLKNILYQKEQKEQWVKCRTNCTENAKEQ